MCGASDVHFGTLFGYAGALVTKLIRFMHQNLAYLFCCACGDVQIAVESEKHRKRIARDWPIASPRGPSLSVSTYVEENAGDE
jgi:hypothetical protein